MLINIPFVPCPGSIDYASFLGIWQTAQEAPERSQCLIRRFMPGVGGRDDKIKLLKVREVVENRARIANILTSLITNIISISALMWLFGYIVSNFKLFKTLHQIGKAKDHLKIVGMEPMGGTFKFIYAGYYSPESKAADQHMMNLLVIGIVLLVIVLIYVYSYKYKKVLDFIDF